MAILEVEKLLALPEIVTPNTLYFILNGEEVNAYIADEFGNKAYPITMNGTAIDDIDPYFFCGNRSFFNM